VTVEDEDMALVSMQPMPGGPAERGPVIHPDRDTAMDLERLRLQAEMDREREARRERRREEREERRREREADRDRRREEERKERQAEEARRADREAQTHALMVQVLKEMAAGRQDHGRDDTLLTAVLAKFGQPDPLVLKLLDNHGKREELTDFIKAQAESMRMASSLQTDSLKSVMAASQEVQSQLLRQAVEVASARDGGGAWDSIGSVLSGAAGVIAALRTGELPATTMSSATATRLTPVTRSDFDETSRRPVVEAQAWPMARKVKPCSDPVGNCLRLLREVHQGQRADNDATMHQLVLTLPDDLADAIRINDLSAIQRLVLPAIQADVHLAAWLRASGVDAWLTTYLSRVQIPLSDSAESTLQSNDVTPHNDSVI